MTHSQRQLAAMADARRALETLADIGNTEAQEHRHALDLALADLDAIEKACRVLLPTCEAIGARAMVAAVVDDALALELLANDLDKETIALLEECLPDITHRSPARGKRMRAHLAKLQERIRKVTP